MKEFSAKPEKDEEIQEVDDGGSADVDAGIANADAPTTEEMLRSINALRKRLTPDQVNWVRESVLLDGMKSAAVARRLYPAVRVSSIWALVRGKTYRDVPLSRRLKLAYRTSIKKRQVPAYEGPRADEEAAGEPPAPKESPA
jgi:hypothetical protein